MSQQLNLLNPRLQRRRDALSLSLVALVLLAVLLVEAALASYAAYQRISVTGQEAALQAENKNLQQQVEAISKSLAERKPSARLADDIVQFNAAIQPREEALGKLKSMEEASGNYANTLRGFSRQSMEGVWLTDFSASANDLTIRGRLTDSALLPVYVRRLNEEPAFKGRRFAALDMKGVEPPPLEKPAAGSLPPASAKPVVRLPPYVEFALQGTLLPAQATKPGSGG